jgi:hypothetical protein
MNTLIAFCTGLLLMSCEKDDLSTKLDTIPPIAWRSRLGPEFFDILPRDPYIYKNKIIFGYQMRSGNEGYYIFDKNTGALLKDIPSQASFEAYAAGYGNLYFSKIGVNIRTINMETYEVISRKIPNPSWTFPTLTTIDNLVFFPRIGRKDGNPDEHNYEFVKYVINSDMSNTIIMRDSFRQDTNVLGTSMKFIAFNDLSNGERLALFPVQSGYWKVGSKSRYKIVCHNLTKNSQVWQTQEFMLPGDDDSYVCDFKPIIIDNTLILGLGGTHIYGFDIVTGQEKWLTQVDNFGVNMIEYNGKLTFISMQGDMYLIDARLGAIIKKSSVGPANIYNFSFHKGVLYFSTVLNKLFAVNADTHAILWETKSPNSCSYCTYGFAYTVVDPETDRLYISDGKEVICYQLK